jgi:hypothetical protein
MQFKLAGFQFWQIKNFVYEPEQMCSAVEISAP